MRITEANNQKKHTWAKDVRIGNKPSDTKASKITPPLKKAVLATNPIWRVKVFSCMSAADRVRLEQGLAITMSTKQKQQTSQCKIPKTRGKVPGSSGGQVCWLRNKAKSVRCVQVHKPAELLIRVKVHPSPAQDCAALS